MSAAVAQAPVEGAGMPVKAGRKKLIIIGAAAALLVLLLAAGGVLVMRNRAAQAAALALDDDATASPTAARPDLKHPPVFLPLDAFVVNLADKETDRYAQIGITFEIEDAKLADQLKAYMPAIRNAVLLILAQKTSADLLDRAGKERLAAEIRRDAAHTLGIDVEEAPTPAASAARPKAGVARHGEPNPIRHVHFSNFIIQ